jgi:hypothetical protein
MWCVWQIGEVYRGFWWGNLSDRDHLGDPVGRWVDNNRWDVRGVDWIEVA